MHASTLKCLMQRQAFKPLTVRPFICAPEITNPKRKNIYGNLKSRVSNYVFCLWSVCFPLTFTPCWFPPVRWCLLPGVWRSRTEAFGRTDRSSGRADKARRRRDKARRRAEEVDGGERRISEVRILLEYSWHLYMHVFTFIHAYIHGAYVCIHSYSCMHAFMAHTCIHSYSYMHACIHI